MADWSVKNIKEGDVFRKYPSGQDKLFVRIEKEKR